MGMSMAVSASIAISKEKAQSNTKTEKATYTVAHELCHAIYPIKLHKKSSQLYNNIFLLPPSGKE
jgi:Zn-dependent peptidase ImmA (M78 family)